MNIEKTTVQENGFEGAYYRDSEKNDRAMIINITFGGDSIFVKKLAQWLIENKTDALGITISRSKETGKNQSEIPLEYIESAINYLKNKRLFQDRHPRTIPRSQYEYACGIVFF